MEPKIVEKTAIILAGFSFYGSPFETKDPWTEENEIGKLWQRFMSFMQDSTTEFSRGLSQYHAMYEVHIWHPDTMTTGELEIFVGVVVKEMDIVPVECLIKYLPPSLYAIFTLQGEEINSDWSQQIYQQWMPQAGYSSAYPYSFQYYDHRFKGLDNLAESELDVYIPIK
jgi:predicted transcriptional regulator YdeE